MARKPAKPREDGRVQTNLRLSGPYRNLLVDLAEKDHRSLSDQVEWLIREEASRRMQSKEQENQQ